MKRRDIKIKRGSRGYIRTDFYEVKAMELLEAVELFEYLPNEVCENAEALSVAKNAMNILLEILAK